MSEKRFTTNGYYINDTYHDGRKWLVNEVEAEEIVDAMNGLDKKARESRKAISKLQKENEQLRKQIQNYEQLISNSYVGEEETLDGFVGKYVIWETELQKYRKKNKNEMSDDE